MKLVLQGLQIQPNTALFFFASIKTVSGCEKKTWILIRNPAAKCIVVLPLFLVKFAEISHPVLQTIEGQRAWYLSEMVTQNMLRTHQGKSDL